ncbi:MAG: hypothetical protein ILP23_04705, partial [Paludibacteraceae bacterium]|nr:hypothetical protein [Paludibacteraceae bacterium]
MTAVNPAVGAIAGGALMGFGNEIIHQTSDEIGLSDVYWGNVVGQTFFGAVLGGATYTAGVVVNQTGIINNILDATGITNKIARNIVGSTVGGAMIGTAIGLGRGIWNGVVTGNWNIWENTWKSAVYGGAGGLLYGSLTEA